MNDIDYKSNSDKSKENQKPLISHKKLKVVTKGTAKPREQTVVQKAVKAFLPEDIDDVKEYIVKDIIVPMVIDAIEDAVHFVLRGETGHYHSRPTAQKVSYQRFYSKENDRPKENKVSNGLDYQDIVFETRGDAERVLSALEEVISCYDIASIGDLYELANVQTSNYAVNRYGWTNVRSAQVLRVRDGYLLKMPKASPLD